MADDNPVPIPTKPTDFPPLLIDPFRPVMFSSTPVIISEEQRAAARRLLLLTSSDSNFAQKAADGLFIILAAGVNGGILPVITSITPNSGVVGNNLVRIAISGSGFLAGAQVVVNGAAVPTTVTSPTRLDFALNLTSAIPGIYPVIVRAADGTTSNVVSFTVTVARSAPSAHSETKKEEE